MKTSAKTIIIIVLLSSVALFAFTRRDGDPLGKLTFALQHWTDSIPQEKVYLHMDKPYYALGDTIWFKGYLTIGSRHQLSAMSGAMYVELISEKDSVLQQLKLPVTSGMVMGNFTLKDDYHQGSYRIRAYTQWMRNAGEDYFYDHTFTVGDVAGGDVVAKADFSYRDDQGKRTLTAILNYTNDEGKALGDKPVRYEIWANHKVLWQQNSSTDALGSLRINIPDDIKQHPEGAYLHTTLQGSDKSTIIRDFPVKATLAQTDVQFFPEGGSLVNGIISRIAYKTVGIDGLGVNMKGNIVDNDNKEVAKLDSIHAGMGSFLLTPVPGKTYSANITFEDGSTKNIALPKAADEGYVLRVYQPHKDSVLVRIHASVALLQRSVNLIVHTNGAIVFASSYITEKPITSVWLSKKAFPTGIAQFTLFDAGGEALLERIAFIRSNDMMQLNVKTAKTGYSSKERVMADLEAKDSEGKPTAGNFSVSVVDESKVPFEESKESTIFSNLLLTSDLKGYVEQPNYYFTADNKLVNRALDNLMLTQGYRRFTWKELNNTVSTKPQFPVEDLGTSITGRVTTLTNNKPVPNANISLIALRANAVKSASAGADGKFRFDPFFLMDSIKLSLQARTSKGSDKVILLLDSIPTIKVNHNPNLPDASLNIQSSLKQYLESGKKEDDTYEKLGMLDKVHRLKEVKIRAKKVVTEPAYNSMQGPLQIPEGHSDKTIKLSNPEGCSSLAICLAASLPRVVFEGKDVIDPFDKNKHQFYPLYPVVHFAGETSLLYVVLDGRLLDRFEAGDLMTDGDLEPSDIVKMEYIFSNQALMNMVGRPPGPVLFIYTNRGKVRHTYNPSMANITPKGFDKVREFYSPRYDKPKASLTQPDLRSTVYWNPYLKTDVAGQTSFNFFNADGPGTYKVTVEGINAAGQLGRVVYRYTVGAGQTMAYTAPVASNGSNPIIAPLDSFNKRMPIEKAYVQTDKPYYVLGDTIWLKGYLPEGARHQLSAMSGAMYVELISEKDSVLSRLKLPVSSGTAAGNFILKEDYPQGSYRIRAYTQWMRNAGEAYFYDHTFTVGDVAGGDVVAKADFSYRDNKGKQVLTALLNYTNDAGKAYGDKTVRYEIWADHKPLWKQNDKTDALGSVRIVIPDDIKLHPGGAYVRTIIGPNDKNPIIRDFSFKANLVQSDVQFFPESGSLVNGIASRVAFKAVGVDGSGIHIKGNIVDNDKKEIATLETLHAGMGTLLLNPQAGKTYTANIIFDDGSTKPIALPKVADQGYVLSIDQADKDSVLVKIQASAALQASSVSLVAHTNGEVIIAEPVKIDKPVTSIKLAKKDFPTGIAQFTLLSNTGEPMNERLAFIRSTDITQLDIKTAKTTYNSKEQVQVNLEAKDGLGGFTPGNFSVAVVDETKIPFDENKESTIFSHVLLTSDLKGYVEEPNYYFAQKGDAVDMALDNLMLTQGYRRFAWKDPGNIINTKPAYPVENLKTLVSGRVTTLIGNKPVPDANISLVGLRAGITRSATSDADGKFHFEPFYLADSVKLAVQARTAKGSDKVKLVVDSIPGIKVNSNPNLADVSLDVQATLKQYLDNGKKEDDAYEKLGMLDKVHRLNEVKIRAKKPDPFRNYAEQWGPMVPEGHADYTFKPPYQEDYMPPGIYLQGQLPKIIFNSTKDGFLPGAVVYLNGRKIIDHDELVDIFNNGELDVASIIKIDLIFPSNPLKNVWGAPAMLIYTKKDYRWKISNPSLVNIMPKGYDKVRQFYLPKYDKPGDYLKTPDLRSTVYWNPDVKTDINGKTSFSFFNADGPGTYKVTVEGITDDGQLARQVYRYTVDAPSVSATAPN
ncbi:carboxypeptidase-like regulatory domain-containing protein [Mucilaginibacter sp. dw_454]|uniref:carboxypeptidase-like regulatory domain-containing protein n=1 Tax=Mucilaginibacter sp. dw_454 TaxID=2720079 RepID=UPI001BD37AF2|nr:carboxypeptidase-like regulatory domain-containing protein [Mucilaginibacter sp. dw_454]